MQANTISQTQNFKLALISFVVVSLMFSASTLIIHILPVITDVLPYMRQELSNLVAQTLYIR